MINNNYEGKKYKFKKNSIKKVKSKYDATYQYVLLKTLRYKKNLSQLRNTLNIKTFDSKEFDLLLLNNIEDAAMEFNIDNSKVYSLKKFNRKLIKSFNKTVKYNKKHNIELDSDTVKLFKKIDSKDYKDLRKLAFEKPNDFLKAVYLYTICED